MAEKSFVTAAHHEDVREVSKDPQTEQQYPSKEVFSIEEGGHMKNKTSWLPSDKNKAEHRREKHPEEYRHEQAKRDHELHNAPRSDVPPAFRQ